MRNIDYDQSSSFNQDGFSRREPQISVRRANQDGALAMLWFFAAAVTLVLSMSIARLLS